MKSELLCTVGPTLNTPELIAKIIAEGVSTIRINFSHGQKEDHLRFYNTIRAAEKLAGKPVRIMGEIQGPKFRVGMFKGQEVQLKEGQTFTLDSDPAEGDETRVCLPHPEFMATAQVGD